MDERNGSARATKASAAVGLSWGIKENDQARAIAGGLVREHRRALRANPDVTEDDVVQRAVIRIWESRAGYDASRGSFSTFCGMITRKTIADVVRKNARRNRIDAQRRRVDPKPGYSLDPAAEPDLAEWLADIHGQTAARLERFAPAREARARGRRPAFTVAQALAIHALRRRKDLSVRGVVVLLATSEPLRAALRLPRVPGRDFVHRAEESVRQMKKILTV